MSSYQDQLGDRLRAIRQQQGLTLQQVEERSRGEWKAVVVGSYERGDRAVSVTKLAKLAEFYGVPVQELLPQEDVPQGGVNGAVPKVVVDLTRLNSADEPALKPISRYVHTIQVQRGDYNGRMITLRRDDLRALAIVLGLEPDDLIHRLEDRGVLISA